MVPHLNVSLAGPINELEQHILSAMPAIERWFRLEWMEHTPPFYSAVDIRNAGFKLAPVDTNLYPAGWNHLAPEMLPLAVQAAMAVIERTCPEAKNLLLVPDLNLKDLASDSFYLANILQLQRIFRQAGLHVRIGSISPELTKTTELTLPTGETMQIEPVQRNTRRLFLKDFDPCTVLLNHHLSTGIPGILEDLNEQYVLPPLQASATVRSLVGHLKAYEEVAKRFCKMLGIDHWLIAPMYVQTGSIDFSKEADLERLQTQVEQLLSKIKKKYKEFGLGEKPFVVLKPNKAQRATTGQVLALHAQPLSLQSADEVLALKVPCKNAKTAKGAKAKAAHEAQAMQDWIIQEGVYTNERMHEAIAEPVVYMMDRYVVGGFYRVHAKRGTAEKLSAPGAHFVPLAFEQSSHLPSLPESAVKPGTSSPNRFYMYGVIARLAMLAASYELEASDPLALDL